MTERILRGIRNRRLICDERGSVEVRKPAPSERRYLPHG